MRNDQRDKLVTRMAGILLAIGWILPAAAGQDRPPENRPFSFDFEVIGPGDARPKQAFYQPGRLYLDFPDGVEPEGAEVLTDEGWESAEVHRQAPYYFVKGPGARFRLATSEGEITIQRQHQRDPLMEAKQRVNEVERENAALQRKMVKADRLMLSLAKQVTEASARKVERVRAERRRLASRENRPSARNVPEALNGRRDNTAGGSSGAGADSSGNPGGDATRNEEGQNTGVTLALEASKPLSRNLRQFLDAHGWNLVWNLSSDYRVDYGFEIQAASPQKAAAKAANLYKIPWNVYMPNKVVVIGEANR